MNPSNATAPNLLLVEDDPGHALLIQECLKPLGGRTKSVRSRAEASRAFAETTFDLAIVDIALPDGTGFDIQDDLRSDPSAPRLVFVTADELPENVVRAFEAGAVGYVIKRPGFPNYLTKRVQQVLGALPNDRTRADREIAERALSLVHQLGKEIFWIRTHARRLEQTTSASSKEARSVQTIKELSEGISASAQEFLRDARESDDSSKLATVGDLIDSAIRTVTLLHGEDSVICSVSPDVSGLSVNRQVESVIVNLLDNALRAMTDRASVELTSMSGKEPVLQVVDTGVGMTREVLQSCFDFGFTTRARQGGQGVGLALSKRMMHALGGRLKITSQPGVGTTATLQLPSAI